MAQKRRETKKDGMTDKTQNTLVLDGAYLFLRSLPRAQRIPRYRSNGLPARTAPLSSDLKAAFDNIGSPESVRPSVA